MDDERAFLTLCYAASEDKAKLVAHQELTAVD